MPGLVAVFHITRTHTHIYIRLSKFMIICYLLSKFVVCFEDGCPGSVRLFKLGPGVNTYVSESKQRIEEVKEGPGNGVLQMKYTVLEGELRKMYDPYTVTFSFRGDEKKKKCIAGWRAEYEPISPNVAAPEKAKDAALRFMKAIEDFYLSSNFLSANFN